MRSRAFSVLLVAALFLLLPVISQAQGVIVDPATPFIVPGADTPDGKRIMAKLNSLIIDKLNIEAPNLKVVVAYLSQKSKEIDPDHTGVTIVLRGPYQAQPPAFNRENPFQVTEVPLLDALRYLCNETNYDLKIEDNAVVLFPKQSKTKAGS